MLSAHNIIARVLTLIHEFRRYRIKVGKLGDYVAAFEQFALPPVSRHMHLLGFWTSDVGEQNCVFHLWAFENTERRTARFAALRSDLEYQQKFLPLVLPLVEHMHSTLLTQVGFSSELPLGNAADWNAKI